MKITRRIHQPLAVPGGGQGVRRIANRASAAGRSWETQRKVDADDDDDDDDYYYLL